MDHKLFVINKHSGPSSFEVVKALRTSAKLLKVGHAGTLDPLAEGVLLLLSGRATKAAALFMDLRKTYVFEVLLGVETSTLDGEGIPVDVARCPDFSAGAIAAAASKLIGVYDQVPPAFSAIKQNGKRLYELARQGKMPEVKKRPVTVYRFDVLDISLPVVRFRVECSRGTYVRSLAKDVGALLNVPAHVRSLTRTAVGPFGIETAFPARELCAGAIAGLSGIDLGDALQFLPAYVITEKAKCALRSGIIPDPSDVVERIGAIETDKPVRILDQNGVLCAVGRKESASADPRPGIVDSFRLFLQTAP
ncbi:MAG: tRNA pseudouridine(55) synthase TruB [Chitinivibrionia bacterium]|nr:tRNA pseudouridine(55) synthase TruB [Chitinivibrionia bacterium]